MFLEHASSRLGECKLSLGPAVSGYHHTSGMASLAWTELIIPSGSLCIAWPIAPKQQPKTAMSGWKTCWGTEPKSVQPQQFGGDRSYNTEAPHGTISPVRPEDRSQQTLDPACVPGSGEGCLRPMKKREEILASANPLWVSLLCMVNFSILLDVTIA